MAPYVHRLHAVLCFTILCTLIGCGDQPNTSGPSGWCLVDDTFVGIGGQEGRTTLLIFCDCDSEGGGNGGVSVESLRVTHYGSLQSRDGRTIRWECETSNGETGNVKINDRRFKLEDGNVFLVRTLGHKKGIEQLRRDLSEVPPTDQGIERLMKRDKRIRTFVAEARKLKKTAGAWPFKQRTDKVVEPH